MMKSLRYQAKSFGQYLLLTVLVLLVSIVYGYLFSGKDVQMIIFRAMSYMILGLFILIFSQNFYGVCTQMALSYGATRRGWFKASIVASAAYALLGVLVLVVVMEPLGLFLFGQPVVWNFSILPFALVFGLFLVYFGNTMGYLSARFGMKWVVITMLAFILVIFGVALAVAILYETGTFTLAQMIGVIAGPLPIAILLALCVGLQFANWGMLRNMAVRG